MPSEQNINVKDGDYSYALYVYIYIYMYYVYTVYLAICMRQKLHDNTLKSVNGCDLLQPCNYEYACVCKF